MDRKFDFHYKDEKYRSASRSKRAERWRDLAHIFRGMGYVNEELAKPFIRRYQYLQ